MSIPKKIHYVWVGGNPKPKIIKKCMKTWIKNLPDYEIKEWNENNFNIYSHPFVKAAYEAKKWAFVSDYIRAYAIYNEGGIYFDTDVLLVDNIDNLLLNKAFVGFENEYHPFTAVFGAEKEHPFVKKMLDYYDSANFNFNFENNNTLSVSNMLIKDYNCKTGDFEQDLVTGIKVYESGVLCNPSYKSKTIHVFSGTWLDKNKPFKNKINQFLKAHLTNKKRINLYLKYIKKEQYEKIL